MFSQRFIRNVLAALACLIVSLQVMPSSARAQENPFPGRFPAPSLEGGVDWLNTSGPIELRDLRGKIVLLDFWTYCCINCMHILPDLKYLEEKYADQLVVIGVHSAKFDNEKDSENIRQAIMRYGIKHPVVNDANMEIARRYQFNSWPTLVLIDPLGNFVGRQPGEGTRELFDRVIGKMVEYHRSKGTLDESPISFELESAKPTPLRYPGKLLADPTGKRLFISDSNHNRIVISSLAGELIDVIGTGAIGAENGGYDEATFHHPQGMALVDETLYVADTENHLIREVDLKNQRVSTLAGTGEQARVRPTFGGGGSLRSTALNSPWALLELNNVLYVAMAGPHQLWRHTLGSNSIGPFAGSGKEDIIDGSLRQAALAQPSGLATDGKVLYHVDSEGSAVRRDELGSNAQVTTIVGAHDLPAGRSLFEFGDIDGTGDQVRMQHPIGLAYHDGFLYVADTYNDKIKKVNIAQRTAETWLGTGERGTGLDPVQLTEPAGLSIADNTLYIADTNNHRILKADLTSKATEEFVVQGLTPPKPKSEDKQDTFAGKTLTAPSATVGAGKPFTVNVELALPSDHELNELAPVSFKLTAVNSQELVPADVLGQRQQGQGNKTSASIEIPMTGKTGSAEFLLEISYQYCRHGTGGLCRFGSHQWKIPLTVAETGPDSFTLKAPPLETGLGGPALQLDTPSK